MSTTDTEARLSKQFWAITEQWTIEHVTGYECPPNDKVWWVPQLGYSMTEGFHLFDSFEEGKERALKELSGKINALKQSYNQLLDTGMPL